MSSYKTKLNRDLKKELKVLKARKMDTVEFKFVANLLGKKLQKTDATWLDNGYHSNTIHYDQFIGRSFWGYVKTFLKQVANTDLSFTKITCSQFLTDLLASVSPGKFFSIPNWVPLLSVPKIPFDICPPTYQQVTTVIRKMRSSASPCPLDQISIICHTLSILTIIRHKHNSFNLEVTYCAFKLEKGLHYFDSQKRVHKYFINFSTNYFAICSIKNINNMLTKHNLQVSLKEQVH